MMYKSFMYSILPFAMMFDGMADRGKQRKVELRKAWKDSRNLPRKKKKQARKEIKLDWEIACFDENLFNFSW